MALDRSAYDEKFETILHHAAIIFAQKGYHQASIRDIARATGVSLSGLYYYFESKEELLFLIQDHALGLLLRNLEDALSRETDPRECLRLLIRNHVGYFADNMPEMKVLSHEADSLTGDFSLRLTEQKRRVRKIADRILADLRPDSTLDPRVSVFSLFGMINWIYTWYRPSRDVPVDRLADEMTSLFLGGFLNAPSTDRPTLESPVSAPIAIAPVGPK